MTTTTAQLRILVSAIDALVVAQEKWDEAGGGSRVFVDLMAPLVAELGRRTKPPPPPPPPPEPPPRIAAAAEEFIAALEAGGFDVKGAAFAREGWERHSVVSILTDGKGGAATETERVLLTFELDCMSNYQPLVSYGGARVAVGELPNGASAIDVPPRIPAGDLRHASEAAPAAEAHAWSHSGYVGLMTRSKGVHMVNGDEVPPPPLLRA